LLRGLARRNSLAARSILKHAARFEPDAACRRIARLALASRIPAGALRGSESLWLKLNGSEASVAGQAVVVQSGLGETRVVLPDPDGFVGVVGLVDGPIRYTIESGPN
jgi:hypothetical protein